MGGLMKVSFVGAGRVGASAAFATMLEYMPDEIVLVDVIKNLAKAQALDLSHAAVGFDIPTKITGSTSISEIKNSDVVVITAGKPRKPNQTRIQLVKQNAKIVEPIVKKVRTLAKKAVIIMVTNPVDPLVYLAWKVSKFPRNRVFGVGSLVDTAMLMSLGYRGFVMGQHGEYFVPMVSPSKFKKAIKDVKNVNTNILKWKGGTEFGPAMEIAEAVGAVVDDLGSVMPVSVVLDGEYDVRDVAIGVPAVVDARGVSEIIEVRMNKAQRERFMKGVLAVDMALDSIGLKKSENTKESSKKSKKVKGKRKR